MNEKYTWNVPLRLKNRALIIYNFFFYSWIFDKFQFIICSDKCTQNALPEIKVLRSSNKNSPNAGLMLGRPTLNQRGASVTHSHRYISHLVRSRLPSTEVRTHRTLAIPTADRCHRYHSHDPCTDPEWWWWYPRPSPCSLRPRNRRQNKNRASKWE